MRRAWRWTLPVLGWLACIALPALAAEPATGEVLRNEDVVMMIVRGEDPSRVVERIRGSEVDFDLSDEMVEELGIAGIPDAVIRAMRQRQEQIDRARGLIPENEADPDAAPDDATAPPGTGGLRVALVDPDAAELEDTVEGVRLVLPTLAPDSIADQLGLPRDPEARAVGGVALAVLCLEPRHVPDHWRSSSPLGRDFLFTPRHRVLTFAAGSPETPDESRDPAPDGVAAYLFPKRIDVPLEGEGHPVTVGIAVQIGDRWYLVRSESMGTLDVPEQGLEIRVRARGSGLGELGVQVEVVEAANER